MAVHNAERRCLRKSLFSSSVMNPICSPKLLRQAMGCFTVLMWSSAFSKVEIPCKLWAARTGLEPVFHPWALRALDNYTVIRRLKKLSQTLPGNDKISGMSRRRPILFEI